MATNIYTLVASYLDAGGFSQNILHYSFDDSGFTDTAAAGLALCNAFNTGNLSHLKNLLPTTTQITSFKSRRITAAGGFEGVKLLGATFGLRTGALSSIAPSPCAVLFPTGNAKPRGRCFLPGITDTDLVNGEFTSAFRTNFTTHAVMFVNTLTLSGGGSPVATPVVVSRKTVPPTGYTVEYVRLSDLCGTQRRRQRPA